MIIFYFKFIKSLTGLPASVNNKVKKILMAHSPQLSRSRLLYWIASEM